MIAADVWLPTVAGRIRERLLATCAAHDAVILHAVESGSRAWGFPSPDSDYDARFIYVHRPQWYYSVFEKRDVIETPIENVDGVVFDVNGWDLRKALRLLAKSNPVLLEWLRSPMVYQTIEAPGDFCQEMLTLAQRYYAPARAHYHYFHMARKNFREHLIGETVRLKKYFYVLRPVLACLWIERNLGMPPMNLTALLDPLLPPGALRDDILELKERKMRTPEFGEGPPIASIQTFLALELKRLADLRPPATEPQDDAPLDDFLRRWADSLSVQNLRISE